MSAAGNNELLFLIHVLALIFDEFTHEIVEALPRVFPPRQNVFDRLGKPVQAFGFRLMFGFRVADALGHGGIAQLQLRENEVLFRMMVALGIVLKIIDDGPQNFIVGRLAMVEDVQLLLQNKQQLFDVAVLVEQNLDNF